MHPAPFDPDHVAVFRKTVTETDLVLFAGITGDFASNHTDEEYMRATPFGTRQIHGALLVGFMSAVAARALEDARPEGLTPVSLGYDRIRFIRPVFPGQTLSFRHEWDSYAPESRRAIAAVQAHRKDELVAVARHVVTWVRDGHRPAGVSTPLSHRRDSAPPPS